MSLDAEEVCYGMQTLLSILPTLLPIVSDVSEIKKVGSKIRECKAVPGAMNKQEKSVGLQHRGMSMTPNSVGERRTERLVKLLRV